MKITRTCTTHAEVWTWRRIGVKLLKISQQFGEQACDIVVKMMPIIPYQNAWVCISTSTPDSRCLLLQTLGGSSAGSLVPATHMGDLDLAPRPQVFGEWTSEWEGSLSLSLFLINLKMFRWVNKSHKSFALSTTGNIYSMVFFCSKQ